MNAYFFVGLFLLALGVVWTLVISFSRKEICLKPLRYAAALITVDVAVYLVSKIGHYYGDEHPFEVVMYSFAVIIIAICVASLFLPLDEDDNWINY